MSIVEMDLPLKQSATILRSTTEPSEEWTGRWFPDRETTVSPSSDAQIESHSREMGLKNLCDDGKINLEVDFLDDDRAYICMTPRDRFIPDATLPPLVEFENIPLAYEAEHRCMNESISYSSSVPTFGPHRQLWPKFGEYKYLPAQRWIHVLEHGGITALYHPCADLRGIALLKKSVQSCLKRHVSTPWPALEKKRPYAVVAWGVRMTMSTVNPIAIRAFIQSHALQGPEKISKNGQFDHLLLEPVEVIATGDEDAQLCPSPLAHD